MTPTLVAAAAVMVLPVFVHFLQATDIGELAQRARYRPLSGGTARAPVGLRADPDNQSGERRRLRSEAGLIDPMRARKSAALAHGGGGAMTRS